MSSLMPASHFLFGRTPFRPRALLAEGAVAAQNVALEIDLAALLNEESFDRPAEVGVPYPVGGIGGLGKIAALDLVPAAGSQHGGITGILAEMLEKAGKKPGDIIVGGIDLGPATIDGLKSGYVSATLDQLLYLQGFMPVLQCVLTAKYKMPGLSINTGAGTVTPATIDGLVDLIDAGIR